jgi:hypothetical protein
MCGLALASTAGVKEQVAAPPPPAEVAPPHSPETRSPENEAAPVQAESKQVDFGGGPSFLGLTQPASNTDYLLEEEPRRRGASGPILVLIVILAILLAGWVVTSKKPGWITAQFAQVKTSIATILGSKPSPDSAPTPPANDSVPAASLDKGSAPQPAAPTPANSAGAPTQDDSSKDEKPAKPPTQAASIEKIPSDERENISAAEANQDAMIEDGEKYLYGRNVRQDCNRARSNLMGAANLANPKAQSILGTMYATGHCVPRDLPLAYRWFLQAKQKDPGNAGIDQDLRLVWKQMTPEEQRIAGTARQ